MKKHYLHASWRMEYVRTPREKRGSPFVRILNSTNWRRDLLLYRDEHSFIVMNRYPYNAGHLLVLPVREVGDFEELTEVERLALFASVLRAQRVLKQAMQPEGFNIGFNVGAAAGAGIASHLHAHVVPRWNGDTNFMPVVGKTKVLPEALETLYDRLLPFVEAEK
ncbi:MAG: HIT domain-containing protein [Puniceicoccales bacterium]|jgi:ATP adenylyltransferase|nr:HIT domain-containing protein [Puniceicoccales bacterium]